MFLRPQESHGIKSNLKLNRCAFLHGLLRFKSYKSQWLTFQSQISRIVWAHKIVPEQFTSGFWWLCVDPTHDRGTLSALHAGYTRPGGSQLKWLSSNSENRKSSWTMVKRPVQILWGSARSGSWDTLRFWAFSIEFDLWLAPIPSEVGWSSAEPCLNRVDWQTIRKLQGWVCGTNPSTLRNRSSVLSHRMHLSISFNKSTPPQTCQLSIYYCYLKCWVAGFVRELNLKTN